MRTSVLAVLRNLLLLAALCFAGQAAEGQQQDSPSSQRPRLQEKEAQTQSRVSTEIANKFPAADPAPLLWSDGELFADRKPADELLHRRGQSAKHFRNADGSVTAIISKGSIHYQDDSGLWREIRTDIRPNESGQMTQYPYAVTENRHKVYFGNTVDDGYIIRLPEGDLTLGTNSEMRIESVNGDILLSIPRSPSEGGVTDNMMTFGGTYPLLFGYDELIVHKRGVKHDVVLNDRPVLLDAFSNASHLVLREFVKLPEGWSVVSDNEANLANIESVIDGSLHVIDENGSPVAVFPTPLIREEETREIFHANGPKGPSIEYRIEKTFGSYRVEAVSGGAYIETLVPMSWLLDPDRLYPVIIDPSFLTICDSDCDIDDHSNWTWPAGEIYSSSSCTNQSGTLEFRGGDEQQIYMFFRTYTIPENATINWVNFNYYYEYGNWPWFKIRHEEIYGVNCYWLWWDAHNNTEYDSNFGEPDNHNDNTWYERPLGNGIEDALESTLSEGRFGLAIQETDGDPQYYGVIDSYDFTSEPFLRVSYNVPPPQLPDLVAYINCLNEPWQWGDTVEAFLEVCNNGNASAGSSEARLVMSNDSTIGDGDDVLIQIFDVPSLSAGSCANTNYSWPLPDSPPSGYPANGTVWFGWIADSNNDVQESLENNNTDYDPVSLSYDPCQDIPPDQAYNPSPSDEAIGVPVTTNIYWSTGNCTSYSELFFGTDPTPDNGEYMGQQSSPWNPPDNLQEGTTYYWQINTFNSVSGQATEGEVWEFKTVAPLPDDWWTILIHGANGTPAGHMGGIADRIELLDPDNVVIHTMNENTFTIMPGPDANKHNVLMFDWSSTAYTSDFGPDGYGYAAGDALFALVKHLQIENKIKCVIGYSRGAVVASEFTRRMHLDGSYLDQVIYLDGEGGGNWPNNGCVDGGLGFQDCRFDAWGDNGVTRYDNIYSLFDENGFDCYYDNFGGNPNSRCYDYDLGQEYQHGNCDNSGLPSIINYLEEGLLYNNVYNRFIFPDEGGVPSESPLDPNDWDGHSWDATLMNGDISWYGPKNDNNNTAGWFNHGGGGDGHFNGTGDSARLILDTGNTTRTHSWFWVPDTATVISLDYLVENYDQDCDDPAKADWLLVRIERIDGVSNDYKLVSSMCSKQGWQTKSFVLESIYTGKTCRLKIWLDPGTDGIDTEVWIDNVRYTECTLPSAPTNASASPRTICAGGLSILSASVPAGQTVEWFTVSCGGTPVPGGETPQVSPRITTTYYARALDNSTGCISTTCAPVTVYVIPLPTPPSSASSDRNNFCADDTGSINLSVSGGSGDFVQWFTGGCDATPIGKDNPLTINSPTETTIYYARWETSCDASACVSVQVNVLPLPIAEPLNDGPLCQGQDVQLAGLPFGMDSYYWTGPKDFESTEQHPIVSQAVPGEYWLTVTLDGCVSTPVSTTVTVNSLPSTPSNASADDTDICPGKSTTLTASVKGAVIYWYEAACGDNKKGSIGTGNSIIVSPNTTTTYYARARFDEPDGCFSADCDAVAIIVIENCGDYVGETGGSWFNPKNWGGGQVPNSNTHVTIPAGFEVVIDQPGAVALSVTIQPNATLLLANGTSLNVGEGVTIKSGGTLTLGDRSVLTVGTGVSIELGGTLNGTGTVNGDTFNYGFVQPGLSLGTLTLNGTYQQFSSGTLVVDIDELQSDVLNVSSTISLDGTLQIDPINSYSPQIDDMYDIILYKSVSGGFASFIVADLHECISVELILDPNVATLIFVQADLIVDSEELFILLAQDLENDDELGYSVAVSGDITVVGVWNDDPGLKTGRTGSAYLFRTSTGEQLSKLLAEDGDADDGFGISVGIDGTTVIVGAYAHDSEGPNAGAAYLYDISDPNNPVQTFKLVEEVPNENGQFGYAVDVNAGIAIVGAYYPGGTGLAYLFDALTGLQIHLLQDSDGEINDQFGKAVSIDGSFAIVGAPADDNPELNSGSASIFDVFTGIQLDKFTPSITNLQDEFGFSVAIRGSWAHVGAIGDSEVEDQAGTSYLFNISKPSNAVQEHKLIAPDGAAYDWFGYSVGLNDLTAIVGAPFHDGGTGAIYLYYVNTGQHIQPLLEASNALIGDQFGRAVSIDGEYAVIGAPYADADGSNRGTAYVFLTNSGSDCDHNGQLDQCDIYFCDGSAWCGDCNNNGMPDECDILSGKSEDSNNNGIPDECEPTCPWDLDNSGFVSTRDLLDLFAQWGTDGPADFDESGIVDENDLVILLDNWGLCK